MTFVAEALRSIPTTVIPAKAGIQATYCAFALAGHAELTAPDVLLKLVWVPASAGMTECVQACGQSAAFPGEAQA
ncbi:hypothetical protein [Hyphomicrobium sp. 99]|uniref:hypothetical protein n=1 Tax=Hyphomicrobium sp. 99 TaxID=1163419 RepID=UPI0005F7D1D8|nr:hypothetical protein [Hyphomicrobium sp. 99]